MPASDRESPEHYDNVNGRARAPPPSRARSIPSGSPLGGRAGRTAAVPEDAAAWACARRRGVRGYRRPTTAAVHGARSTDEPVAGWRRPAVRPFPRSTTDRSRETPDPGPSTSAMRIVFSKTEDVRIIIMIIIITRVLPIYLPTYRPVYPKNKYCYVNTCSPTE